VAATADRMPAATYATAGVCHHAWLLMMPSLLSMLRQSLLHLSMSERRVLRETLMLFVHVPDGCC